MGDPSNGEAMVRSGILSGMMLNADDLVRRLPTGMLAFAQEPRRVAWALPLVPTRDGHEVAITFILRIAVPPNGVDRATLVELLLNGRDDIQVQDIVDHLSATLTTTVRDHLRDANASDVMHDDGRKAMSASLRSAAERAAFATGIEVIGPIDLRLESKTLAAAHAQAAERSRAEADAQRRVEHLRHAMALAETVGKSTDPAALLAHASPNDQPAALAAILMAGATRSPGRMLFAAAGSVVLQIDPSASFAITTLTPTGDIGPIRSVQRVTMAGDDVILVGAQRGVATVSGTAGSVYLDTESTSRLGFNAVAYLTATDEIWASHSQRGVVRWRRGEGNQPVAVDALFTDAAGNVGAQDLVTIDGNTVAFSSGARVFVSGSAHLNEVYTGATDIVGLVPDGPRFHVVHADGSWVQLETGTWRPLTRQATGNAVAIATGLPWAGGVRLLLARRDGGIDCLGVDDALVTRYASRHVGFRGLAASDGYVTAMTADRQRLVFWHTADGREPVKEIHVASIAGSRVAGIGFA